MPAVASKYPFEKLGLRTSHMSEVIFENAFVGRDALLGRVGGGSHVFAQSMDWERVCLGAIHIGTMQRLLELCVARARTRREDGEAIGKNQGVSHPIADMKMRLDGARLLMYHAASRLDRAADISLYASLAKLAVSEALTANAHAAVRLSGDEGIREGHETERALRDSVASTIYSGTSEIQRNIISRWLGL